VNATSPSESVQEPRGLTLAEVAEVVGGEVAGAPTDQRFLGVAPLDGAGEAELGLLSNRRYLDEALSSSAGAFLVTRGLADSVPAARPRVVIEDANSALVRLLPVFEPAPAVEPTIHRTACLEQGAQIASGVSIGALAVVGARTAIGPGTILGAHVVIGEGCQIGADCVIHPRVTLYPGTRLGDRVEVHSGATLGADGFGYAHRPDGHHKVPQIGGCLIEDDVEIGAGTCIDRGSIGDTVIGAGTKIDNLVHIAHNVRIGRHSIIIAQVGIAGSTRVGQGAVFGGQAGIVGHLTIGAGARIGAQAGVIGDVPADAEVIGFPARPRKEYLRAMASAMNLQALRARVKALERTIEAITDDPEPSSESPE